MNKRINFDEFCRQLDALEPLSRELHNRVFMSKQERWARFNKSLENLNKNYPTVNQDDLLNTDSNNQSALKQTSD